MHFYELFFPLLESEEPAKISCERKTIKWATKLPTKRKARGKRRECEKKNRNRFPSKSKLWLLRMPEKEKMLNYLQLAEI